MISQIKIHSNSNIFGRGLEKVEGERAGYYLMFHQRRALQKIKIILIYLSNGFNIAYEELFIAESIILSLAKRYVVIPS